MAISKHIDFYQIDYHIVISTIAQKIDCLIKGFNKPTLIKFNSKISPKKFPSIKIYTSCLN